MIEIFRSSVVPHKGRKTVLVIKKKLILFLGFIIALHQENKRFFWVRGVPKRRIIDPGYNIKIGIFRRSITEVRKGRKSEPDLKKIIHL